MELLYYNKITRFILGSDLWLELDPRLYTRGHFKIQLAETGCIRFIPNNLNLDDSASFSLDSFFNGETYFNSVLSPWSLRLVKAVTAPDSAEPLSDLDLDLITAIESNIDPDYTKTDQDYIQRLIEFSNFRDASYLVATDLIIDYVRANNSDYSDYMLTFPLPKTTVRDLLIDGVRSAAEYIYFEITPLIIQRYIAIYKDFYKIGD